MMNMYYYEVINDYEGEEQFFKGVIAAASYEDAVALLTGRIYDVVEFKRLRMIYDGQYLELPEKVTCETLENYANRA